MQYTSKQDEAIANIVFAKVYPMYLAKVEKKGRTKSDLNQVIHWLTGFDEETLQNLIAQNVTFKTFFDNATIHPNAKLIKGLICGYRVEDIQNPITQQIRYLDKLIDELAKGKSLTKIMRST